MVELDPDERARLGLFLAFQYPVAIPGVSVAKFLKSAADARAGDQKQSTSAFLKELRENMKYLEMDPVLPEPLPERGLLRRREEAHGNPADADAEARRLPSWTRPTPGLDIDALRIVSKGVNKLTGSDPGFGLLVITHYERILTLHQAQTTCTC
jgi:Fe-S cluster assembly ATP-binding protein